MGTAVRNKNASLNDRLNEEAYRFDFFQAVRLLQSVAVPGGRPSTEKPRQPVGGDFPPSIEAVRFRALDSLGFPPGAVDSLENTSIDGKPAPPELIVSLMGLTGPAGVLPDHYTRRLIRTGRIDDTLSAFFGLFHHRAVSLFYRAWEKYHFFVGYERTHWTDEPVAEDAFTKSLHCLVGLGERKLRHRLELDDQNILHYSGFFSNSRPTAVALEAMLHDYFDLPIEVQEFQGRWLRVGSVDRTRIAGIGSRADAHNQLGRSALLGRRVWDIQSKFRVRIGPLDYTRFRSFRPGTKSLKTLCQLVRLYTGAEWDFDIRLVLQAQDVPRARLASRTDPSYLGHNTWLHGKPMKSDVEDAVYVDKGLPSREPPRW